MRSEDLPRLPPPGDDRAAWLHASGETVAAALGDARWRETWLSWCRLATFAGAVAGFFALQDVAPVLPGMCLALGFGLFLVARHYHRRQADRVALHALLETVLEESVRRSGGHPSVIRSGRRPAGTAAEPPRPPDAPPAWHLTAQEIEDLDLYAEPIGLFGLLNRTSTRLGAVRLARTLEAPLLSTDAIRERQNAGRWLGERPDARLLLAAAAAGLREQDDALELFTRTVRDARPLPRSATHPALRIHSFLGMAAAAAVIAIRPGWWLSVLLLLSLINTPFLLKLRRELLERIRPWIRLDVVTRRLASLAHTGASTLPAEGELGRLRRAFERATARAALPALAARIPFLFLGFSGALHKVVNALTLWDVHFLCALERSYLGHRDELLGAVEALADLEVLISLGAFAWEQPVTCLPEIRDADDTLVIEQGFHPLIPPDEAVPNDLGLRLPMRVWIITGSNMSGKSTFLRMVGVCTLLAQCGSAVPAASMTLAPTALLTDLRVRDDLGKHESYFLAEVRQVKRILDRSRHSGGLLGLIDEPFRGTNSEERLAAATAVIQALIAGSGFLLVATHDRQVTGLADDAVVANRHFEESLTEDALSFDYRIRSGPATARNAIRVLRAEGYPDAVVRAARRIVEELER